MIETQILMTVSDLFGLFTRNHFLEGSFTFSQGGVVFQIGGFIFKWGGGGGVIGGHWFWDALILLNLSKKDVYRIRNLSALTRSSL